MKFNSYFKRIGMLPLPEFSGVRVMMMPVQIGNLDGTPEFLNNWRLALNYLFELSGFKGCTGYLTIDEKEVKAGRTHRRAGLHVDGVFQGKCGGWGGGGGWGSVGNGMLTISNIAGCRAWNQDNIEGFPGYDGECDHLAEQLKTENETIFLPNNIYWVDGLCIHESMPIKETCKRQFVRLSMPSNAPWFEGYTVNPKGIMPTGEILPRRKYVDY